MILSQIALGSVLLAAAGVVALRVNRTTKEAKQWLLIKHRDRFVTADDVTQRDRSVLSGIAVSEMKTVPGGSGSETVADGLAI